MKSVVEISLPLGKVVAIETTHCSRIEVAFAITPYVS